MIRSLSIDDRLRMFAPRFERDVLHLRDGGRFYELKAGAFVVLKGGPLVICASEAEYQDRFTSEPG